MRIKQHNNKFYLVCLIAVLAVANLNAKKPFTHNDAMKFKAIRATAVSDNGKWIAYTTVPDRGDGELTVITPSDSSKVVIPRGDRPVFSKDGFWLAAQVTPKLLDVETAKTPKDKPKAGMALLRNSTGKTFEFENIEKFKFSNDSKWLLYQKFSDENDKSDKMKKKSIGSEFTIRHLASGTEIKVPYVNEFLIDSACTLLFYSVSSPDGKRDGIYWRNLKEEFIPESSINKIDNNNYSGLAWNPVRNLLAYISTPLRKDGRPDNGTLLLWDYKNPGLTQFAVTAQSVKTGYYIPSTNTTKWTEDGKKLFFGVKPVTEKDTADVEDIKLTESNLFNQDTLQNNADDLIWHWNDDRISSNQINWWGKNKNRTFASVYDADTKVFFQLADEKIEDVKYSDNSSFTIGSDESPYIRASTWGGFYSDLYVFDLNTGKKKKIAESLTEPGNLSPMGKYIIYFKNKNWYVYIPEKDSTAGLTGNIPIPFYDVDNDVPFEPGSYGVAGWFEGDNSVLVNEKYDIYRLYPGDAGSYLNQTATVGRKFHIQFRIKNLDPDKKVFKERDTVFMHGFNEYNKSTNLYLLETNIAGGINISTENGFGFAQGKNYLIAAKPKFADYLVYTRESFDEFPNLWVGNNFMDSTKQVTDVNPQMKDFIWGTTEQIKWKSPAGDSLDGYLIKPDGFDPKKKYPVLVYFYEKFSDQTFRFYQPRINHRPLYQVYLGDDYLIFVPDIVYRNGRPGTDATEAITSGVQTLIDRGIADTKKIGIQGHSWGAYQTAYIVTQTDMFAAASAGAPVGNMTSAYSQIRTESGLARQFQYEKYQSRIGGNLWDSLDSYLRNSPVFHAGKAKTPLLVLHGNVDEAVPFSQGVELYLAFRRLSKNCVLVEYKNEPHAPRKYENKLDWAIKMKEWYDHYVLGKPAAKWITDGRVYMGNK
jgi:dipeptidyl aminopeptidase/acylaminoacyl peptidase